MTIRVVPDAGPSRRRARRVRADERHPRPEAGAGGVARLRGRAAAHHGQRAGARRLHRHASTAFASSTATTRSGSARSRKDLTGPQGRRRRRRRALRADAAAARARAEGRGRRDRADARAADRRAALGGDPLRAEPRRRRQGHRHLRGAHRRPRPEEQRGRAAPRELDAVVAHQQHAARGARVGPRLPPRALVAAGGEHLRLDAPTKCSACRSTTTRCCTTPIAARSPACSSRADERRGAARDGSHAQQPQGRRHDLVRVVPLGAARRRRQDRVDPVVRAGRLVADPGRGAAAVHGHARRADRAAEPPAAARAPDAGDRAGEARRPPRRRAVHRPRPLQERQRHARPPDRRRAAEGRDQGAVRLRCARPTCWRASAATSSW